MFGGPWIFMNRLLDMREEDLELAASEIQLYKRLRLRIRDGKVFHLTERPTPGQIDAIESYDPGTGSAVVFVHRFESSAASRLLPIRGLDPERNYRVRFQESRRLLTMTGRQLMVRGVGVELPIPWMAEIVYVDPVETPQ
jgi:hypothetical protein